jgi:hypothetical protein
MKAEEKGNRNGNQLPVGAYVCQILDARVEGNEPDQRLAVIMEIYEGEYKGWFMKRFNYQKEHSKYKVKYKGYLRLRIPNPENTKAQYPESDMRKFNDFIAKLKNSNPNTEFYNENGFDENLTKGKLIGISVGEDEYNGAVFTKPMRFENVDDVRQGRVQPIERKQQDPTPAPMVDQRSGMEMVNTEALPWDQNDRPY